MDGLLVDGFGSLGTKDGAEGDRRAGLEVVGLAGTIFALLPELTRL